VKNALGVSAFLASFVVSANLAPCNDCKVATVIVAPVSVAPVVPDAGVFVTGTP